MSVNFDIPTRHSMFARLHDDDEQAWSRFVKQYSPMIAAWCLRQSLTESEAADVTQNVLVKLVPIMRESRYDPTKGNFRSWLKTVTNNAVCDVMRTWNRPGKGSGCSAVLNQLQMLEDPRSRADLEQCIDEEYQRIAISEASHRVKARVRDFTWRAYEITAIEQRPAQEAAEELNMKIAEVYVAKSRVIKMLREEIRCVELGEDNVARTSAE